MRSFLIAVLRSCARRRGISRPWETPIGPFRARRSLTRARAARLRRSGYIRQNFQRIHLGQPTYMRAFLKKAR